MASMAVVALAVNRSGGVVDDAENRSTTVSEPLRSCEYLQLAAVTDVGTIDDGGDGGERVLACGSEWLMLLGAVADAS